MRRLLLTFLTLALVSSAAFGFDVYKYSQPEENLVPVPDADKPGVAGGNQAPGLDQSCWLAAAANILAGAGWGPNANPQINANNIYSHLTGHFSTGQPGNAGLAANWWLLNYGYNPGAPDINYYDPTMTYNDITRISYDYPGIMPGTGAGGPNPYGSYDWLLDELDSCQYITVLWELPSSACHWLTLVGGDYSNQGMFQKQSVWHDSDRDWVPPPSPPPAVLTSDDNAYLNGINAASGWSLTNYTTVWAQEAELLCEGLQKPQDAIENYDYAYFKDQDLNGAIFVTDRLYDGAGYGNPTWIVGTDSWVLDVPNREVPNFHKEIYLLIDYLDRDNNVDPGITITLPDGTTVDPTSIDYSDDDGQILLTWVLDYQPASEKINFPDVKYWELSDDVKDWNLATVCIPEPTAVFVLTVFSLGLLRRRD